MATATPWGMADYVQHLGRGVRFVSTSSHGGMMVSKKKAEKELPEAVRKLAIVYGGNYCFEEDCAWKYPAIVLREAAEKILDLPYEQFVKKAAGNAVKYGEQDAYIAACAAAGIGEAEAKQNMTDYIKNEVSENVRRNILKYADDFEATGKRGWSEEVHEGIMEVAGLFQKAGVTSESPKETIFSVGKTLVDCGAVGVVQNAIFLKYHYAIDETFLPVLYFAAA